MLREEELSYRIRSAVFEVSRVLGAGCLEKDYGTDFKSVPAWSLEIGDRLQVRPRLKSVPDTARSKPNNNNNDLPAIPGKHYFTIGEVAELCAVKAHVLRYWEQEFPHLSRQSDPLPPSAAACKLAPSAGRSRQVAGRNRISGNQRNKKSNC